MCKLPGRRPRKVRSVKFPTCEELTAIVVYRADKELTTLLQRIVEWMGGVTDIIDHYTYSFKTQFYGNQYFEQELLRALHNNEQGYRFELWRYTCRGRAQYQVVVLPPWSSIPKRGWGARRRRWRRKAEGFELVPM